ncbi:hypothetical protein [Selenomonas sp. ND2010]|uniref:hypothetical protein n=1 Tax=Selenomonas sp. ND2010 TaxID=1410618 RepID=UPI00051BF789|nr:hypothetical protein [Selenomonas sp. ND2010]
MFISDTSIFHDSDFSVAMHGVDNLLQDVCEVEYIPTHETYLLTDEGIPNVNAPAIRRLVNFKNAAPEDSLLAMKIKEVAREFFDERETEQK